MSDNEIHPPTEAPPAYTPPALRSVPHVATVATAAACLKRGALQQRYVANTQCVICLDELDADPLQATCRTLPRCLHVMFFFFGRSEVVSLFVLRRGVFPLM